MLDVSSKSKDDEKKTSVFLKKIIYFMLYYFKALCYNREIAGIA